MTTAKSLATRVGAPILVSIGMLTWLAGCSSVSTSKRVFKSGEEISSAQVGFWLDQRFRSSDLKNVLGKLRLSYQTPKESISARGQMLRQGLSRIRMELRDPLGKLHLLAVLDGSQFSAVYPRRKVAYLENRSGNLYFKKTLGFDLSFRDIESLSMGALPAGWRKDAFDRWDWDPTRRQYVGRLTSAGRGITVRVDGERLAIREIEATLPTDSFRIGYQDMASCCRTAGVDSEVQFSIAHRIELTSRKRRSNLQIEFENVDLPERARPRGAFEVALPENIRKIRLD